MPLRRVSARSTSLRLLTWPICALSTFIFLIIIISDGNFVQARLNRVTPIWNETWTDRLKRDLLLRYDKFARPAQHFNTTIVYFDMEVTAVSLDDFKSSIIVQAWVKMKWMDEKLKWNASMYGGLHQLHVGNHEVWQPDILLYNSVAGASIEYYGDTHCIIYPDGTVLWTPPTQFFALCDLDLRLWPFDTQRCVLKLGSWMYLGDEIDLRISDLGDGNFDPQEHHQYTEWRLIAISKDRVTRNAHGYDIIKLNFNLTVKRHSPMYYATVVAPATTIAFLILVIFWLPPQCSEKITLCGCTALIISIFLINFGHKVPPLPGKPPLLICFYSGCLYLVTISLIISAFVINLSRRPYCRPLPRGIKKFLVGRPGQYLALSDHIQLLNSRRPIGEQELRESHATDTNTYHQTNSLSSNYSDTGERENIITPTMSTAQFEWILAATAIDRLTFYLFSIIFAIMAMVCLA